MATYILALQFAKVRGEISDETYKNMIAELQTIPDKIAKILDDKERIQWFAAKYANAKDVFFIGRGIDYAVSMEGSLKLKEISYIHSEAYASGELKHGTISLIEEGTLVIALGTYGPLFDKAMSNVVEVQARGGKVVYIAVFGEKYVRPHLLKHRDQRADQYPENRAREDLKRRVPDELLQVLVEIP